MNKKQNLLIIVLIFSILGFSSTGLVKATDTVTSTASTSTQALIQVLQQQIQTLKQQIQAIANQLALILQTQQTTQQTLKLSRELKEGMRGDDVKLLQQILATDPSIYPEGIVSGYFGKLTAQAMKRFKAKVATENNETNGNDNDAKANSSVISRMNEILLYGAGKSGKVPPGLLKAPGILKKLNLQPTATTTPATTTPATTTQDTTAPVISQVLATSTTASSVNITWLTDELSTSQVWYSTSTPVDTTASSTASVASSSTLVLSHLLSISELNASTTYYYRVASTDANNNTATSSTDYSFATP
ncbi:MAG: fibronectin type III domain-containing protein [Candidatus Pacebacteria bacterium]|nr:fibronectin type III domain-containing protein [Candidatus Paceibacterota bacterium]